MNKRGRPKHPDILTPREWEVLGHVREGRSNEQIAERLGISIDGVKYHVSEILSKLNVENRHDAARWAEGQSPRPRWAGALAPLLFWRRLDLGWLTPAIAGGVLLAVVAGLGVLIWGLLATRGGEEETVSAPVIPATTAVEILNRPSPNFGAVEFVSDEEGWMTAGGGLLHTTDGGATWAEIARITGNDVDFADTMHGWIVGSSGAIYRSDDGGQSWSEQDSGTGIHLWDIEAIGAEEAWAVGTPYSEGSHALPFPTVLLHTTDGGTTWQQVETPEGVWFDEVAFAGQSGWAVGSCSCGKGSEGAVVATVNGGRTWILLDTDIPYPLSNVTFIDETNGWALSHSEPYATTDGGRTWALKAPPGYRFFQALGFRDARTGLVVAMEDKDDCPCERFVLETADGGETWRRRSAIAVGRGAGVSDLQSLGETIIITGSGIGLRSTNGAESFEAMRTPAVGLGDLEFVDAETGFTVKNGLFMRTEDGGLTWEARSQLDGTSIHLSFVTAEFGFASSELGTFRTTDGGQTWESVASFFGSGIEFFDDEHGWVMSGDAFYVTEDGGETWDERSIADIYLIRKMRIIDENQAWAVVDTDDVNYPLRRLIRTDDTGRSWEVIREDIVAGGCCVELLFDAVSRDIAWYIPFCQGCLRTLLRTSDGGDTWLESDIGVGGADTLEFADEDNGWLSARYCLQGSCTSKLLRTQDGGETWQPVALAEPVWGNLVVLDAATGWLQPLETGFGYPLTTVGGRTLLYQLR